MAPLEIKKSTGETQDFDEEKLLRSLCLAGASDELAQKIVTQLKINIPEGASTKKVFTQAFRLLKKESKFLASQYSLAKSIHELGPDGFLFEQYVCAIFSAMGYESSTNYFAKGRCVKHEIDIIAKNDSKVIFCECKFHNHPTYKNDLKTALYVQARHEDLKANSTNNLSEFWLISNTKFSKDAIEYAECVGLKLLGPNYPHKSALADLAKKYHVHPITCLTSLKKIDAKKLLKQKVVLTKQLIDNPKILEDLKIKATNREQIIKEATTLMQIQ